MCVRVCVCMCVCVCFNERVKDEIKTVKDEN